jgi:lipoprotein NlpI
MRYSQKRIQMFSLSMKPLLMLTIRPLLAVALLSFAAPISARDIGPQLATAQERYRAGDFDSALQQLEPLLSADDLDQPTKQHVRELAGQVLQMRGEEHFRHARVAKSIADFDRQIQLQPNQEPAHWQRGIAYYYAGEYDKGARQFKLHQTVNPQDVENAVWHFVCVARALKGSIEVARKNLIPVARDSRIPMAQIQALFAGTATPEEVLRAGEVAGGAAKFYADLYVGLYYEASDRIEESLRLIARAADNPAAKKSYMGDVARVHLILRKKSTSLPQSTGPNVAK